MSRFRLFELTFTAEPLTTGFRDTYRHSLSIRSGLEGTFAGMTTRHVPPPLQIGTGYWQLQVVPPSELFACFG